MRSQLATKVLATVLASIFGLSFCLMKREFTTDTIKDKYDRKVWNDFRQAHKMLEFQDDDAREPFARTIFVRTIEYAEEIVNQTRDTRNPKGPFRIKPFDLYFFNKNPVLNIYWERFLNIFKQYRRYTNPIENLLRKNIFILSLIRHSYLTWMGKRGLKLSEKSDWTLDEIERNEQDSDPIG